MKYRIKMGLDSLDHIQYLVQVKKLFFWRTVVRRSTLNRAENDVEMLINPIVKEYDTKTP